MRALSLPEAVPAGVEVWLLELDLDAPVPEADWRLLSDNEAARAHRYRRHEDRLRAVATRAALRRLLGERLDRPPASLSFDANLHGKPRLPIGTGIEFNVAHSGRCALIAVGVAPGLASLGVDVEQHHPAIDFDALAAHALTASERECLPARDDTERFVADFFLRWAGKEAVLKAVGVGISENLQRISIQPRADGGLDVQDEKVEWPLLRAHVLDVQPDYAAALAWQLKE
ncbi:MAG: 4'-phosphopantetheinyl transferase family protein [Rhodocyclaceae bacterium]